MKQKNLIPGIFLTLGLFACTMATGQVTLTYYTGTGPSINTYSDVLNGGTTSNYLTLETNNPNGTNYAAGWTMNVHANGDFMNGTSSVPSQYVSLKFNSVKKGPTGVSGNQVPLTATDAVLLNSTFSLKKVFYMAQNFDLIVQGGNQLLVPTTGTYSTTVTITLKDANGAVIATNNNVQLSFTINYSNACTGLALAASFSSGYNFTTYSSLSTGGTASQAISIQYTPNGANCVGWSLKVRANGNFTNGTSSFTPDHVSLAFNSVTQGSPSASAIGVTNTPVALSTSDVALINNSAAPFQANTYTAQSYDMIIQGGNYLLTGTSGTYSCPLTFSVYNQSGQLVATANLTVSFTISYNNSYSYTVTLSNPSVTLEFATPSNYLNGVSVTQANGLSITGYSSYQVIAKTTDANLSNGTATIPVSVIQLSNSAPAGKTAITSTTINLSTSDQVIITNPLPDYTYQTIQYNLQYTIQSGNASINTSEPGSYSTQLVYVVLPK